MTDNNGRPTTMTTTTPTTIGRGAGFTGCTIPGPIPEGWRDESWGNDAAPCIVAEIADRPGRDRLAVRIYVDRAAPFQRYEPGSRFTVTVDPLTCEGPGAIDADAIGDAIGADPADYGLIYNGDRWADALRAAVDACQGLARWARADR